MKITWVTRSFLDYRIPVYQELDRLCGGQLSLIYFKDVVPARCQVRLESILKERAIGLSGELRLSGRKNSLVSTLGRKGIRIPWQPGLIRKCRENTPEVMVSDGFFQWTYAALWLRMRYGIPHAMCYEPTAHTEQHVQLYRTWYRRLALKYIDAICCNGTLCRDYTLSLGASPEKLGSGNMAADSDGLATACRAIGDMERDAFRQRYGLRGTVFLFVGRLVKLKGLFPLLEAWKTAQVNASLLLVGTGDARSALEDYCSENKLTNIVFAGNIDYDLLPIFYRSADVFIIPTLQDNWSLVVPEAMACGLPIASSIYNGCHPELVKPENGWLFDPLNCEATAHILKQINSEQERFPAMGEASRRIVADFSPAHAAQNIYHTCEQAIKHQRQRELATV